MCHTLYMALKFKKEKKNPFHLLSSFQKVYFLVNLKNWFLFLRHTHRISISEMFLFLSLYSLFPSVENCSVFYAYNYYSFAAYISRGNAVTYFKLNGMEFKLLNKE